MAKATRARANAGKTVNDYVAALVAAEVTAKAGIIATQRKQLDSIVEALKGAPETNQEQFKANWRKPLVEALKAAKDVNGEPYYSEASIGPMTSYYSVAVCAITNGILPNASHGTLMAFVKDDTVRDAMAKKGVYAPKAQRNPQTPASSKAASNKPASDQSASVSAGQTAVQALKVAFAKLNIAVDDARIERLVKVIRQHPGAFWQKVDTIAVV